MIQEFPKLVPGLVTTVLGKLIPGGPVLTTFLHTAQGLSANAQALEQLARKFFDTIELVINPNQNDPTTNKPYVVGDMTRRLLAGALPIALDLAVRQVPTFTDIRATFQNILKSIDLRQILQKAVQKIWTPIEKTLKDNPLTNAILGRRLTKDFHVGANSQDMWAVQGKAVVNGKEVPVPRIMLGAALSGLPPKGTPVLFTLGQWREAYQGNQKILALIQQAEDLAKELQDPTNPKSANLMKQIRAYEARKQARSAAKHAPKTRQAAADDAVKKANDEYNKARAAADNDKFMKELEGKLNAILEAMGEKGFTNPLGIETLPGGKYGKILVGHGTDALGATFKSKAWPGTNYLTHAHHSVMRNGPKNADAAKAVADSQAILRKWNIGIDSKENMIWAPNRGHTINYAKNVRDALNKADVLAEALRATNPVAARQIIIDALKQAGKDFIDGEII